MIKLMSVGASGGEHFDYEQVKQALEVKIQTCNEKAVAAFNKGAESIEQSMGATSGSALSGAAGATAKNTWGQLAESYQQFSNYIADLIEKAHESSKTISKAEEETKAAMDQIAQDLQSGITQ